MGLTIHWDWHGPKSKDEAQTVIERMRQRALDLPFESVSDVVHFEGEDAGYDRDNQDDEFGWLKVQARHTIWNDDYSTGWACKPQEIIGFEIAVAPGNEPMEIILATHPKTIQITDKNTGRRSGFAQGNTTGRGGGFAKLNMPAIRSAAAFRIFCGRTSPSAGCWSMPRTLGSPSKFLMKANSLRSETFKRWSKRSVSGTSKSLHSWEP